MSNEGNAEMDMIAYETALANLVIDDENEVTAADELAEYAEMDAAGEVDTDDLHGLLTLISDSLGVGYAQVARHYETVKSQF